MRKTHRTILSLFTFVTIAALFTGCATSNSTPSNPGAKKLAAPQAKETLKTAMDYMTAMTSGDMETMVSLMHDDMVWQNTGDTRMPWIGPWNGKEAILNTFFPAFMENFTTVKWETEDSFASGDTAAFFGTMIGKLNKTGQQTPEFPWALRVKVKDGQVILWNWFEDSYSVSKAFHGG